MINYYCGDSYEKKIDISVNDYIEKEILKNYIK